MPGEESTYVQFYEKREDGRILRKKVEKNSSVVTEKGNLVKKDEKTVEIDISPDPESANPKKIPLSLLKPEATEYGKKALRDPATDPAPPSDQKNASKQQQLSALAKLDTLLDRLSLRRAKTSSYEKTVRKFLDLLSLQDALGVERTLIQLLSRCDSPYLILYVFEKMSTSHPCLSDFCVQQLYFFARTFRNLYRETVPYVRILKTLFEKCALPDVKIETAFGLFAELGVDSSAREMLVSLYGKVHIINYYKEVAAGVLTQKIDKRLLFSLVFCINDQDLAKAPLQKMFSKLGEYIRTHRVEKNAVAMANCVWALLKAHPDLFDGRFDYLLSLLSYLSCIFTIESSEHLSVSDVDDVLQCMEAVANCALNRTIHRKGGAKNSEKISNMVKKLTVHKKQKVRIIPDIKEAEAAAEKKQKEAAEKDASGKEESAEDSEEDVERVQNVSLDRKKLETFAVLTNGIYQRALEGIKQHSEWRKTASYDVLVYLISQVRTAHLMVYLGRISGSPLVFFGDHHSLLSSVFSPSRAEAYRNSARDGAELGALSDTLMAEKWRTLGYLVQEGLFIPPEGAFSSEVHSHARPMFLFEQVCSVIHLLSHPPVLALLRNGYFYDVIYLLTLPKYVKHPEFKKSLKETVSYFVSQCRKEEIALLIRKMVELDGFYTEAEKASGDKRSRTVDDYVKVKQDVRETIASFFITEIDLAQPPLERNKKRARGYDKAHVRHTEKKRVDPATKEEDLLVVEETLFRRLANDSAEKQMEYKTFYKNTKKGKNIDKIRRKVILDYVAKINDVSVSDKFATALARLPKCAPVSEELLLYVLQVLCILEKKVALSPVVHAEILAFAKNTMDTSDRPEIRCSAQFLYTVVAENTEVDLAETGASTYDNLVLSLLIFIGAKKGNKEHLKDRFFKICSEVDAEKRKELLRLYAHLDIDVSPEIAGPSRILEEFEKARAATTAMLPKQTTKK